MSHTPIERNERVILLDSRHLDNTNERLISSIIDKIIEKKVDRNIGNNVYTPRELKHFKTLANLLFLKYTSSGLDGVKNTMFNDKRIKV